MDRRKELEESIAIIKSLHQKMSTDQETIREMDEESRRLSAFDSKDLLKPFTV